jgi:hypothetical protein
VPRSMRYCEPTDRSRAWDVVTSSAAERMTASCDWRSIRLRCASTVENSPVRSLK